MRESSEVEAGIEIADADGSGSGRWDGVFEGVSRLAADEVPVTVGASTQWQPTALHKERDDQGVPAKQREWHSNKPRRMLKEEVYKGRAIPLDLRSRVGCAIPDRVSLWNPVRPLGHTLYLRSSGLSLCLSNLSLLDHLWQVTTGIHSTWFQLG